MTMSATCNECGKTQPMEGLFGWTKLESFGIDTIRLGEEPGPWHFCSDDCLLSFASMKADRETVRRIFERAWFRDEQVERGE